MRQHISVWMLAAKCSLRRVAALLAATAAVETAMFILYLKFHAVYFDRLEDVLTSSRVSWAFAAGLLLLSAILCWNGCAGSGAQYTLSRLSVGERVLTLWWAGYNFICLLAYWGTQLLVMLLLCRLYTAWMDPALVSSQTVFLAFYGNKFLHSLLPLAEASRYACNFILIACMAFSQASFSYLLRRKQKRAAPVVLCIVGALAFARSTGNFWGDMLLSIFALSAAGISVYNVWRKWDEET